MTRIVPYTRLTINLPFQGSRPQNVGWPPSPPHSDLRHCLLFSVKSNSQGHHWVSKLVQGRTLISQVHHCTVPVTRLANLLSSNQTPHSGVRLYHTYQRTHLRVKSQ